MPLSRSDGRSRISTIWKNRRPGESLHLPCADSGVRHRCPDRAGLPPGESRDDCMERDSRDRIPIRRETRTVEVGGTKPIRIAPEWVIPSSGEQKGLFATRWSHRVVILFGVALMDRMWIEFCLLWILYVRECCGSREHVTASECDFSSRLSLFLKP